MDKSLAFESSGRLYQCLKGYKHGQRFNCNHPFHPSDQLCCAFFKKKDSKTHRRAKVLDISPIDLNIQEDLTDNEIDIDGKFDRDGAQRRGIIMKSTQNADKASFFAFHEHSLQGPQGYDRNLCLELRVPCRFVNDHPCCNYEMPLDLVARSRALDGSADLKWRPVSLGGPRTVSRGRSLFTSQRQVTQPKEVINNNIKYNYAMSKKKVTIPNYHYDGGPEMTSTIVGLCWRLHYVQCDNGSQEKEQSPTKWINASKLKQIHPCCQLLRNPSSSPIGSRVSRWLHHTL